MIKIVFSDMDGTLLNNHKLPSREDMDTIRYLKKRGIPFCITTGRSWFMVRGYVRMMDLWAPTVAANGAIVAERDGGILFRQAMRPEDACAVAERMAREGRFFRVYTADHIYTFPHAAGFKMLEEYNSLVQPRDRTQVLPLPSPDVLTSWEVFKILGHDISPRDGDTYREEFGGRPLNLVTTEGSMLDVTSSLVNKSTGVLEVCKRYGVTIKEAAVMGDDNNDVPMLKAAGCSGAPMTARPAALASAQYVLPSNDDSPLTYFVEEIMRL